MLAEQNGWDYCNVNLELSRQMLELTKNQRARNVERLMKQILTESSVEVAVIDNLEILFDPRLQVDPLRLLKSLSRNVTVVAAWNGCIEDGFLTYAEPHHPEHRSYREADLEAIVVQLGEHGVHDTQRATK